MNLRSLSPLAAAAGLCVTGTADAQSPAGNQQLAEAIAAQLTSSGAANAADVSVGVSGGVVTLTGSCKDQACKDGVIHAVRTVAGVKKVRDGLTVGTGMTAPKMGTGVMPAQATEPLPIASVGPLAAPLTLGNPPPMAQPGLSGVPMMAPPGGMGMGGPPAVGPGEPLPLGMAGPGGDMAAPPLPPYAWPTYAPYNNVSRVGYPTAYPYNAFPFIGPFYPFPKVPLGWRKVLLEWEDGHWWIGKTQAPQDYWRVRFW